MRGQGPIDSLSHIIEEIPFMLPDELRDGKDDLPFLRKWKDKFPEEIFIKGKPLNKESI